MELTNQCHLWLEWSVSEESKTIEVTNITGAILYKISNHANTGERKSWLHYMS